MKPPRTGSVSLLRAIAPLIAAGAGACASPEASRVRAGGQGADIGNRGQPVVFHGGAVMYYQTPCVTMVRCHGPAPAFGTTPRPD